MIFKEVQIFCDFSVVMESGDACISDLLFLTRRTRQVSVLFFSPNARHSRQIMKDNHKINEKLKAMHLHRRMTI